MTRRRFALVVFALTAAAGVLAVVLRLHAAGLRAEGLRLAEAGYFAEAEPLLRQALARNHVDLDVVKALALGQLAGKEPDAAEEDLTRWCELAPGDVRPHRLRMDLRHGAARRERVPAERLRLLGLALADGRHVLELEPDNEDVRREVVWLLLGVGRFDEAEQVCRRCLARAPEDRWLLYLLARALHGRGDRAGAEAPLDPVVRDQPGFADGLLLRATLHREAGRPSAAIALLRQALALERCPRRECLYQLGLALAAAGQDEEARRVLADVQLQGLQSAVANDQFPNNPAMRAQIAEAMLDAGKAEEARALLDGVLAEAPDFAPAHRLLALYYEQKGEKALAAEHRRKVTR